MVHLNKIYTRGGDEGKTSLGDGSRVEKTHPRILAYGGVDELNSVIGIAIASKLPEGLGRNLKLVQNDLFDTGADLCIPQTNPDETQSSQQSPKQPLRMTAAQTERLEKWIDEATDVLEPLTSFVLPGGTIAAAMFHHARTVCRRVEIEVLKLADVETVNPHVLAYLNRLSDYLFVLARIANNGGKSDVLWEPGKGLGDEE